MFDLSVAEYWWQWRRSTTHSNKKKKRKKRKPFAICALLDCQMSIDGGGGASDGGVSWAWVWDWHKIRTPQSNRCLDIGKLRQYLIYELMWMANTHMCTCTHCEIHNYIRQLTAFAKHPHIIMSHYSEEGRFVHFFFFFYSSLLRYLRFHRLSCRLGFTPLTATKLLRPSLHAVRVLCGLAFQFDTCRGLWSTKTSSIYLNL